MTILRKINCFFVRFDNHQFDAGHFNNLYFCRMRVLLAVCLSLVLLWQTGARLAAVTWYVANKQMIESELCEQREVEDNCCKGKCVLKKEIDKTQEQAPGEAPKIQYEELVYIFDGTKEPSEEFSLTSAYPVFNDQFCPLDYQSDIFQPPCSFRI